MTENSTHSQYFSKIKWNYKLLTSRASTTSLCPRLFALPEYARSSSTFSPPSSTSEHSSLTSTGKRPTTTTRQWFIQNLHRAGFKIPAKASLLILSSKKSFSTLPRPGLRKYFNLFSFVKFKNMLQTGKLELDVDILSNHNMAMDIVVRWINIFYKFSPHRQQRLIILRILKIIGCPHGCSDKNVWASGEFLREAMASHHSQPLFVFNIK